MKYDANIIRDKAINVLLERGIKNGDKLVDSMIAADYSGVSTHGIKMFPAYIDKLDKGEFSNCDIRIIKQTAAFTMIDAMNTIGAISASSCVDIAIEKAKKSGVHIVFSKNSNTLGPAFYYVEKMAATGLIGFLCCNSPAAMPVYNGLERMLGTNPFAFACPSYSKDTVLIDMATSVVAKSKFLMAKNRGEKLLEGWALDKNGNSTTDPDEAIQGFVLPMAGTKGYGLALVIDILAGVLSGSAYLNKVGKFYNADGGSMNVGHMFVAIDPKQIYEGDFYREMDEYIEIIRMSKAKPDSVITIPGDGKYKKRKQTQSEGIELSEETVCILQNLFKCELV